MFSRIFGFIFGFVVVSLLYRPVMTALQGYLAAPIHRFAAEERKKNEDAERARLIAESVHFKPRQTWDGKGLPPGMSK